MERNVAVVAAAVVATSCCLRACRNCQPCGAAYACAVVVGVVVPDSCSTSPTCHVVAAVGGIAFASTCLKLLKYQMLDHLS